MAFYFFYLPGKYGSFSLARVQRFEVAIGGLCANVIFYEFELN